MFQDGRLEESDDHVPGGEQGSRTVLCDELCKFGGSLSSYNKWGKMVNGGCGGTGQLELALPRHNLSTGEISN